MSLLQSGLVVWCLIYLQGRGCVMSGVSRAAGRSRDEQWPTRYKPVRAVVVGCRLTHRQQEQEQGRDNCRKVRSERSAVQ